MNSRQRRDLTVAATLAIIGNQIFCLLFVSNNLLRIFPTYFLPPQHLNYSKVKLGIGLKLINLTQEVVQVVLTLFFFIRGGGA